MDINSLDLYVGSDAPAPRDTGEDFIYDDQGMPWLFD